MELKDAYNKIDNFCCSNHNSLQGNTVRYLNGREEKINMFADYQETKDNDFCKDINEMVEALETIEEVVNLQKEIGCPLDLVLIPYFISGLKKVWYHNQWCDVVRVVAYEEATTPYMEVRCKDYDYLKFIPLTNYKKTFWLKEDKSE